MENPVESGSEEENDVGAAKSDGASGSNVEGVRVGEDAFALGCWEKRDIGSEDG